MALDKLTKLTSQSGITTTIDYQMSDLTVDTITVQSGGIKMPVGMSTFQNVTVTGNLTVNGTTTTLDTDLIGVDKLEVSGNNTTAVGIITQAGSGDILRLYDSTTEVFSVADGGKLTLAANSTAYNAFQIGDGLFIGNTTNNISAAIFHQGGGADLEVGAQDMITFTTGSTAGNATERLRISSVGELTSTATQANVATFTSNQTASTIYVKDTDGDGILISGSSAYGHRIYTNTTEDLILGTNSTEKLRIKNDGKIGIGTNNPGRALEVYDTTHGQLRIRGGGSGSDTSRKADLNFFASGARSYIIRADAADAALKIIDESGGDVNRFHIASSGNIGIGTALPDTKVEIGNNVSGTGDLLKLTSHTNSQSSRPGISFWNNNSNTAQAQISAKPGASYNASKLHLAVANTSRTLVDRACIDEYGTFIIGPGEVRRNTKGSNQHQALLVEGTGNNSTRMSMIRSSNDDNGPEIQLIKTRGTSVGSVTKPNSQDYIGALTFLAGDDSDLYARAAEIAVQAVGTPANDTCPGDIVISVTNFGGSAPTERLRIGAAGITTSNASIAFPDGKQAVFGNSSDLQIWHDGNSRISDRGGAGNLQIESNNAILMQTNDSTNAMAKFFPTGTYQNEFYNDNAWNHPKLRTTDAGIDIFHNGDFGLQFSDGIGEIGSVAGFQAINKAASANTDFGIRATSIRFATGSSERVRIDSSGRLRVGNKTESADAAFDDLIVGGHSGNVGISILGVNGQQSALGFAKAGVLSDAYIAYNHNSTQTSSNMIIKSGGKIQLYHKGAERFYTTDSGVVVESTGNTPTIHWLGASNNEIGKIDSDAVNGTTSQMRFYTEYSGGLTEQMHLHAGGEVYVRDELRIDRTVGNASGFTRGGQVLNLPGYKEYHYTWSGQSSYTIDLTCGSYFHSEFIYTQHQTNGGNQMHHYVRGKWANNHTTHTGFIYEFSGGGSALTTAFTCSDASGGGSFDMKGGLTAAGSPGASYRGSYGGGHEGGSSTASGRLRIAETYGSGSVATRSLIVKVYYGTFSITKS